MATAKKETPQKLAYIFAWKNAFQFQGKTIRKEYGEWLLTTVILTFPLNILAAFGPFEVIIDKYIIPSYYISHLLPFVSISSRRLRDSGSSPFLLILILSYYIFHYLLGIDSRLSSLIAFIAIIFLFIKLFSRSKISTQSEKLIKEIESFSEPVSKEANKDQIWEIVLNSMSSKSRSIVDKSKSEYRLRNGQPEYSISRKDGMQIAIANVLEHSAKEYVWKVKEF